MSLIQKLNDLNVTKDDVVAIRVVEREQNLLAQQKALNSESESLTEQIKKKRSELSLEKKNECERLVSASSKRCAEINRRLKLIGFRNAEVSAAAEFKKDDDTDEFIEVTFSASESNRYSSLHLTENFVMPEIVVKLQDEITDLSKRISENEKKRLEVQMDLVNIDREERNCRALLALTALNETEDGRALLATVKGDVKKLIG